MSSLRPYLPRPTQPATVHDLDVNTNRLHARLEQAIRVQQAMLLVTLAAFLAWVVWS